MPCPPDRPVLPESGRYLSAAETKQLKEALFEIVVERDAAPHCKGMAVDYCRIVMVRIDDAYYSGAECYPDHLRASKIRQLLTLLKVFQEGTSDR